VNSSSIKRSSDYKIRRKNGFRGVSERENLLMIKLSFCQKIKYILLTILFTADPYTRSVLFYFN
jgi:hypothetical protein